MAHMKLSPASDYKSVAEDFADVMATGAREVVVDFYGVDMLQSEVIGTLVMMQNTLDKIGGALELTNVKDAVKDLLAMAGVDKLIKFD